MLKAEKKCCRAVLKAIIAQKNQLQTNMEALLESFFFWGGGGFHCKDTSKEQSGKVNISCGPLSRFSG